LLVALFGLLHPPSLKLAQLCHLQLLPPATPVGRAAAAATVHTLTPKAPVAAAAWAIHIHIPGFLTVCIPTAKDRAFCIAAAGIVCKRRVIVMAVCYV
jgi:hypothetical protein